VEQGGRKSRRTDGTVSVVYTAAVAQRVHFRSEEAGEIDQGVALRTRDDHSPKIDCATRSTACGLDWDRVCTPADAVTRLEQCHAPDTHAAEAPRSRDSCEARAEHDDVLAREHRVDARIRIGSSDARAHLGTTTLRVGRVRLRSGLWHTIVRRGSGAHQRGEFDGREQQICCRIDLCAQGGGDVRLMEPWVGPTRI
jgi:hypothetical protein